MPDVPGETLTTQERMEQGRSGEVADPGHEHSVVDQYSSDTVNAPFRTTAPNANAAKSKSTARKQAEKAKETGEAQGQRERVSTWKDGDRVV